MATIGFLLGLCGTQKLLAVAQVIPEEPDTSVALQTAPHNESKNSEEDAVSLQISLRTFPLDGECSICMEGFTATNGELITTICNHSFHKECLEPLLIRLNGLDQELTCPNCRAPFVQPPSWLSARQVATPLRQTQRNNPGSSNSRENEMACFCVIAVSALCNLSIILFVSLSYSD